MKLKLLALLKSVSKWVFSFIEKAGTAINEADERMYFGDKDERKKK